MVSKGLIKAWEKRSKLRAEGSKLWAEGSKLRAEGSKLRAEGSIVFLAAVIKRYGNIALEWKNWNEQQLSYECHLGNGEIYGFEK